MYTLFGLQPSEEICLLPKLFTFSMEAGKEANNKKKPAKRKLSSLGSSALTFIFNCDQLQLIYFTPDILSSVASLHSQYTTSLSQSLDQAEINFACR